MARDWITKPGVMKRAVTAWCIFNVILLGTLAITVFLLRPFLGQWFVVVPLLIAVIVSEWIIMAETIGPIVKEWINQKELVENGSKPSWDKTGGA